MTCLRSPLTPPYHATHLPPSQPVCIYFPIQRLRRPFTFVGDLDAVVAECVHRTPQSDPAGLVASLRRLTRPELKGSQKFEMGTECTLHVQTNIIKDPHRRWHQVEKLATWLSFDFLMAFPDDRSTDEYEMVISVGLLTSAAI